MRSFFRLLNRFFMVPAFRLGLGGVICNPLTGYIMVLKTVGRKTGRVRYAPVNYALLNGCLYCLAGWGRISDWYRNVRAAPDIRVILPGAAFAGRVEEAEDPVERAAAIRQVLKNGGFAGFFEGFNPYRVSEAELLEKTDGLPLLRIRPTGVERAATDPGGLAWVWMLVLVILAIILLSSR